MRCIFSAAPAAVCLLLLAPGCQHVSPRPLDFNTSKLEWKSRGVDVEPVRSYAAALATACGNETAPFNASDGLSLREAEAVALWYNPDLRIARLQAEQAEAVAKATGRWNDPEFGLESGRKSVDSNGTGFLHDAGDITRTWINVGTLSITIPLSGRLGAERTLRRTEYDVALLRAAEAEWRLVSGVRDAWSQWTAATERIKLLDGHLSLLGEFTDTAGALAKVGEIPSSSARLFAVERMRREAERAREESIEVEQRFVVLSLLGLVPNAAVTLLPELSVEAPVPTEVPDLEKHPTIVRLRAEYQRAEDRLRLELRKQYPDLTLSPNYADEQDETSLRLGLGLPIPVWNANRAGIAESLAAREIARVQAEAGLQKLSSELAQAQAALQGSHAQRTRLIEGVVPVIDEQMSEALSLLKVGEIDIVLIYEALNQALATKEELLKAVLAEALAASRVSAVYPHPTLDLTTSSESDK